MIAGCSRSAEASRWSPGAMTTFSVEDGAGGGRQPGLRGRFMRSASAGEPTGVAQRQAERDERQIPPPHEFLYYSGDLVISDPVSILPASRNGGRMTVAAAGTLVPETLLDNCRQRAAGYDRDNVLPGRLRRTEGGRLPEDGRAEGIRRPRLHAGRRRARNAPAGRATRRPPRSASTCTTTGSARRPTAGAPATSRCECILEDAAEGEVFAAGHAESGNETSILMSITKAEKVPGGYKFTGRKSFGSLTPVWTRLGLHGMDTSDPANPKVVHGFLTRDSAGVTIKETWDVHGHARDAQRRHASSRARSFPTSTSPASSRPASPAPTTSCCRSSRGRSSASATSTTAWRSGCWSWPSST